MEREEESDRKEGTKGGERNRAKQDQRRMIERKRGETYEETVNGWKDIEKQINKFRQTDRQMYWVSQTWMNAVSGEIETFRNLPYYRGRYMITNLD